MQMIAGGVCAALGFQAAGVHAGIKKSQEKPDMALVVSDVPAVSAGLYTRNLVKAWCVRRNQKMTREDIRIRAIVANSGCANACTGEEGKKNNLQIASRTAELIGCETDQVLTGATGVIGAQMPMKEALDGIGQLVSQLGSDSVHADRAAHAIMTTDTVDKQAAAAFEVGGVTAHIGGMVKGSGMIHPNMGTMLCYLTSDVNIDKIALWTALRDAVTASFNMISVDGDTSTNDMAVILANGLAGNQEIHLEDEDYASFADALKAVCMHLAREMVRDGEGATKLIEARVSGAKNHEDAVKIVKSVITSELVKTAFFGEDANFGRVLCAMGYSGAEFDPDTVSMSFHSAGGDIQLMDHGTPIVFDEELAKKILYEQEITVRMVLQEGKAEAVAWGSDLSHDYVTINGDYRS